MSDWIWTRTEQLTYGWPHWARKAFRAPPKWTAPYCDVGAERHVDEHIVRASEPVQWGPWTDAPLDCSPPRVTPWQGSAQGQCVQAGSDDRVTVTVNNPYGGILVTGGTPTVRKSGPYTVSIPRPVRGDFGVEGWPNGGNTGDRHLYLIEADGTAHEMIWFNPSNPLVPGGISCSSYARYAADGTIMHRLDPGGSVVKGQVPLTRLLWNRGDRPHRVGVVFTNLSNTWDGSVDDHFVRHGGKGSDGTLATRYPAYGHWYRLSQAAFIRASVGASPEQADMLSALRDYGMVTYDRGGDEKVHRASIGMIGGAQWTGSRLGGLDVRVGDFERVVE